MAELRLSEDATRDLSKIHEYSTQEFGPEAADAYTGSFEQAFALLRAYPKLGVLLTKIRPPVYCLAHRSHRLLYDLDGGTVVIRRVLHKAMDVKRQLT